LIKYDKRSTSVWDRRTRRLYSSCSLAEGNAERRLTTRQYARFVQDWVASIGLDPTTSDQLLLGHSKIEGTVRYPGFEVDDAIEIAEKIDI
jgi:hypothetical protein